MTSGTARTSRAASATRTRTPPPGPSIARAQNGTAASHGPRVRIAECSSSRHDQSAMETATNSAVTSAAAAPRAPTRGASIATPTTSTQRSPREFKRYWAVPAGYDEQQREITTAERDSSSASNEEKKKPPNSRIRCRSGLAQPTDRAPGKRQRRTPRRLMSTYQWEPPYPKSRERSAHIALRTGNEGPCRTVTRPVSGQKTLQTAAYCPRKQTPGDQAKQNLIESTEILPVSCAPTNGCASVDERAHALVHRPSVHARTCYVVAPSK